MNVLVAYASGALATTAPWFGAPACFEMRMTAHGSRAITTGR
jgi:hypothetical protein